METYFISNQNLHEGVIALTKKLMKNKKNWKKDKNFNLIEFQIEGIIKENLIHYAGIQFED